MSGPPISGPVAERLVELTTEVTQCLLDAGVHPFVAGFVAYDAIRDVLVGPERELLSWEEYDDEAMDL